jgi:hypothetical protein
MIPFQFRCNWRGQLILQRLYNYRDHWGDQCAEWRDATTPDLKIYYEQLHQLQNPCAGQKLTGL